MATASDKEIELALLRHDVQELKVVVEKQGEQLNDLLDAWNTANGLVKFIKWMAGLATAAGMLFSFFHSHLIK